MKLKYFLLILPIIFWIGCEDKDDGSGGGNITVESASGEYTLFSVIVHPGGDCSADDGTSGICFPEISNSQSACVETGAGQCWDEDSDGIEGIEDEANCTGDNRWVNFGWNPWMVFFSGLTLTLSDDGTYVLDGDSDVDESGTWTLDGATLTITDSEGEVSTATVSGNTLTAERIESIISDADCAVMVFTK